MSNRICFDPLYGAVTFRVERLGLTKFWTKDKPLENDSTVCTLARHIGKVLTSFEFNRLNQLKQAGFSWLIHPSATHTRYAHSLGCWYLGEQAMDSVQVREEIAPRGRNRYEPEAEGAFLIDWLKAGVLQEEFMIALLLHDIGHFPFSHVFENNINYRDISHEKVGAEYILGKGPVFEIMKNKVLSSMGSNDYKGALFISEALSELSNVTLNENIVCSLITGDLSYVSNEKDIVKSRIRVLQQLTSGVIDLDRIDHYHRDAYTIGLKIGYVNPIGLLSGIELCPKPGDNGCWIRVDDTSAMQAIALLNTRDMLIRYVFDNPINVAYETMMNCAVNQVLRNEPERRLEFLTWTDCEMLSFLSEYKYSPITTKLTARLLHGIPYECVGKYKIVNPDYNNIEALESIRLEIIEFLTARGNDVADEDVLLRLPKHLVREGKIPSMWKEWLDLEQMQTIDGVSLSDHDMYKKQIQFLSDQYADYDKVVQFYASTKQLAEDSVEFLQGKRHIRRIR